METQTGLVRTLLGLPIFEAEWVLWLLLVLSFVSVAIMVERALFYRKRRVDSDAIRAELDKLLAEGDFTGAAAFLKRYDAFEANVVLFALRQYQRGPESVAELIAGAEARERQRYGRRLSVLATIGSNAPFIGLFGTVLGIIKAFRDLGENAQGIGNNVMFGISEALVATAVGLLVAIPAVVAYNVFTGRLKDISGNANLIARTLMSFLKAEAAS